MVKFDWTILAKILIFQLVNFDYCLVKNDYSLVTFDYSVIYSLQLEVVKFG